ncbi:hypothetical protein [Bacillus massiliigorillae]|uniref:hypothetical protein n=1 Tax=Bacillus massiliigorillae TaxID=1243664 RepID=UPI00039DA778|nr:hypothetical protein [Bacillus massiliigorillae]
MKKAMAYFLVFSIIVSTFFIIPSKKSYAAYCGGSTTVTIDNDSGANKSSGSWILNYNSASKGGNHRTATGGDGNTKYYWRHGFCANPNNHKLFAHLNVSGFDNDNAKYVAYNGNSGQEVTIAYINQYKIRTAGWSYIGSLTFPPYDFPYNWVYVSPHTAEAYQKTGADAIEQK